MSFARPPHKEIIMTPRQRLFHALTSPVTVQERLARVTFTPTHSLQHNPSETSLHLAQDADFNQLVDACFNIRAQNC